MRREAGSGFSLVGGSSLLTIFGVLCLVMLALLSLATALSQQRLSDSALAHTKAYYHADLTAEIVFARLRAGETVEGVQQQGDRYAYACPIEESQNLQVELQKTEEGWIVLRWQVVVTETGGNEALPVWDGK